MKLFIRALYWLTACLTYLSTLSMRLCHLKLAASSLGVVLMKHLLTLLKGINGFL